jgi:hypothetical protein
MRLLHGVVGRWYEGRYPAGRFDESIELGDIVELPRNVVGKVARDLRARLGNHPVARGLSRVGPPVTASLDFS